MGYDSPVRTTVKGYKFAVRALLKGSLFKDQP
jgi:hypothetical protein